MSPGVHRRAWRGSSTGPRSMSFVGHQFCDVNILGEYPLASFAQRTPGILSLLENTRSRSCPRLLPRSLNEFLQPVLVAGGYHPVQLLVNRIQSFRTKASQAARFSAVIRSAATSQPRKRCVMVLSEKPWGLSWSLSKVNNRAEIFFLNTSFGRQYVNL